MRTINSVKNLRGKLKFKDRLAYSNQQRNEYIMPRIEKLPIADEFKPLVAEVVVRRAYEFNLNPQEVERDLRRLEANLTKIELGKMPKGYETAAGIYKPNEKTIVLEKKYFKELMSTPEGRVQAFQTLAHELTHAMSYENGYDSLSHANLYTRGTQNPTFNNAIIEGITEKASHRLAHSTLDEKAAPYNTKTVGYAGMTFVVDAIAAACGVSDKAFMRAAFDGYDNMVSFLANCSHRTIQETEWFLDNVDMNAAKLHAIYYPNPALPKISKEEKPNEVKEALENISSATLDFFADRIASRDVGSSNMQLLSMKDKYRYNKLKAALEEGTEFASSMIGRDFSQDLANSEKVNKQDKRLKTAIVQEEQVAKTQGLGKDKARLFTWAANGNLNNYNIAKEFFPSLEGKNLDEFGINPLREPPAGYLDTSVFEMDNVARNDFPLSSWYNNRVEEMMENAVKQNTGVNALAKTNIFSRIIGKIRGIFGAGKNQNGPIQQYEEQVSEVIPVPKNEASMFLNEEQKQKYNDTFRVVPEDKRPKLDKEILARNLNKNVPKRDRIENDEIKDDDAKGL